MIKSKIKKLFNPSENVVIIGFFIIVFSLFYLIYFDKFGTFISYFLYLIMSYSLIIICVKLYKIVKVKTNKLIDSNKHLKKYKNDYKIRYKISLIVSLIFNTLYAIFKLASGIFFKSLWFISFGLYYLILVILRVTILKEELKENTKMKDEYIKYRNTGVIILSINIVLTMIILIIVNKKIMNIYPEWIAISIAVYTFCLMFTSIYNLIKYRKFKSPLVSSSKVISVITSLVSLISLEIVLIPTFGSDIVFFEIMIMATGLGIAIIVLIISLYMIIKATEWLR